MDDVANKRRIKEIFDELAIGNGRPFVDAMADDFSWIITGTSSWSGTYQGKEVVRHELLDPLFAQFADTYTNTAERIFADGDHVIVECRGHATTTAGKKYANRYCYVIRMADGMMKELTEYADTKLFETALQPRPT